MINYFFSIIKSKKKKIIHNTPGNSKYIFLTVMSNFLNNNFSGTFFALATIDNSSYTFKINLKQ